MIRVSTKYGSGVATINHPGSSCGLPVVVVGNEVYGPAEIGPVNLPTYGSEDTGVAEMHASLERAGYEVYA